MLSPRTRCTTTRTRTFEAARRHRTCKLTGRSDCRMPPRLQPWCGRSEAKGASRKERMSDFSLQLLQTKKTSKKTNRTVPGVRISPVQDSIRAFLCFFRARSAQLAVRPYPCNGCTRNNPKNTNRTVPGRKSGFLLLSLGRDLEERRCAVE